MSYRVEIELGVLAELKQLPRDVRASLRARIAALATDPHPPGAKRLTGTLRGSHRLRVRRVYRIGYEVDEEARVVTVWSVGHRDRFYERATRKRR